MVREKKGACLFSSNRSLSSITRRTNQIPSGKESTASGLNRSIFEKGFVHFWRAPFLKIALAFFFPRFSTLLEENARDKIRSLIGETRSGDASINGRTRRFRFFRFEDFSGGSLLGAKRWTLLRSLLGLLSPQEAGTVEHMYPAWWNYRRPRRTRNFTSTPTPPENFKCPHRIMYYAMARLRIARKRAICFFPRLCSSSSSSSSHLEIFIIYISRHDETNLKYRSDVHRPSAWFFGNFFHLNNF